MPEAQVLVARQGDCVQVRVLGRATFKISQGLGEFGSRAIKEGAARMVIELSACQGLDSTFMGVLAMLGLEARGRTQLVVVNASEQHRRLLAGIGVARLFAFAQEPVPATDWRSLCEAAAGAVRSAQVAGVVLAAHQTLMELDPANVPVFKDVVQYLKEDLRRQQKQDDQGDV
jgi:anti-anti-sigma regulatory factor